MSDAAAIVEKRMLIKLARRCFSLGARSTAEKCSVEGVRSGVALPLRHVEGRWLLYVHNSHPLLCGVVMTKVILHTSFGRLKLGFA